MKKRIIWLVVSVLMVLSLVLASCAPKVTEVTPTAPTVPTAPTTPTTPTTPTAPTTPTTPTAKAEAPKYGGVFSTTDLRNPTYGVHNGSLLLGWPQPYIKLSNESQLANDRLKGPGGSGEWSGLAGWHPAVSMLTGNLAESWEIIPPDTLKFKIRKGIHWQDKPPANGAELTAEDVVYSYILYWKTPGSRWPSAYPYISDVKNPENSIYISPDDPRAVVFKAAPGELGNLWERIGDNSVIVPKALGPAGGEWFSGWKNVVGTGPFILTDFVSGSSLTWVRNPGYWKNDPLYPENQLPYVDGVKVFIIPDLSTQQAALRTAKIDLLPDIVAEDAESLAKTNPELLMKERLGDNYALQMRHDVKPFSDVNVRRAMTMAINYDEIVKDYYGGKAAKFWWPAWPVAEHSLMYVPLEQMPESVQELYGYHPDKAAKLLDEAGLPGPNRFTTSIIVNSSRGQDIDVLSLVAAYWAKVGVTLKIDVKEPAVFTSMSDAFTYEHGTYSAINIDDPVKWKWELVGSKSNFTRMNDPLIQATYPLIIASYFNWPEHARIIREAAPELISRAFHIRTPIPYVYNLWQPWVKGYHGERYPGYLSTPTNSAPYVWIDQDLKEKMTGRR